MRVQLGFRLASFLVCALALASPAGAGDAPFGLQIHAFGGWYYGRASDLQFLEASKGGSAQTAQFALNVSAKPLDRLQIVSQVNLQQRRGGSDVQLDYAFVDFDVTNHLELRAGRAKHPWGIYGEIFDVGTARPFQHLSQAIYGPVGFTGKAYNGLGLTGTVGDRWSLQYDLYGGKLDTEYEESGLWGLLDPVAPTIQQRYVLKSQSKNVVGTRLQLSTPVDGLRLGVSGGTGKENVNTFVYRRYHAYLGSLEYANDKVLVRAEAARVNARLDVDQSAAFVEAAYKFTPRWQLAARWDHLHRDLHTISGLGMAIPPFLASRGDVSHAERIVGLNYWLNSNLVVRASVSRVTGSALLYPTVQQLGAYAATGVAPKDESNVLLVGAQFSY